MHILSLRFLSWTPRGLIYFGDRIVVEIVHVGDALSVLGSPDFVGSCCS